MFVRAVRPHGTAWLPREEFTYNLIFEYFFRKSVEKIQVLLQSNKNNGYLAWTQMYILIISPSIILRKRNISDRFVEKITKHILFSNYIFRKSRRLWDNVEKLCIARQTTDTIIIRRMRFACWMPEATNTPSEYVINCFLTATVVTLTRLNVHCLPCSVCALWFIQGCW